MFRNEALPRRPRPGDFEGRDFVAGLGLATAIFLGGALVVAVIATIVYSVTSPELSGAAGYPLTFLLCFAVVTLMIVLVASPVSLATAILLRPARRWWVHLLGHALAVLLVCCGIVLVMSGPPTATTFPAIAGTFAVIASSAIVSVWVSWAVIARRIRARRRRASATVLPIDEELTVAE